MGVLKSVADKYSEQNLRAVVGRAIRDANNRPRARLGAAYATGIVPIVTGRLRRSLRQTPMESVWTAPYAAKVWSFNLRRTVAFALTRIRHHLEALAKIRRIS